MTKSYSYDHFPSLQQSTDRLKRKSSDSWNHDDVIISLQSDDTDIQPLLQSQHHQNNESVRLPGDVLIHVLSYLQRFSVVSQVSREWQHAAAKFVHRINHSTKQSINQSNKQQYVVQSNTHHHRLVIAPDHYGVFISHIAALKQAESTRYSDCSFAYKATSLTLTELEYDESISACHSRVSRGMPMLMTMHEALEILIQHGPCPVSDHSNEQSSQTSNNQSNNQSNEQSISHFTWPSITSLTLETLDDHRTIQAPRLRALLKTMPNLTELHIKSKSALRPVLRQSDQSSEQSNNQSNNQIERYTHRNENEYQKQLIEMIMTQPHAKLTKLTLPAWMSDGTFLPMVHSIEDARNGNQPHTELPDGSAATDRYPILSTLAHFELEHRCEYFNPKLHTSHDRYRSPTVITFVSLFQKLKTVSLSRMVIGQIATVEMILDCRDIRDVTWRFADCKPLTSLVKRAFMLGRIPSIILDSRLQPEQLAHPNLVQLYDVDVGNLTSSIISDLPRLVSLGLTCRTQQPIEFTIAPPLCTHDAFVVQMLAMEPLLHNLRHLGICHLSYELLVDLLTMQCPALETLRLSFDFSTLDLSSDWIIQEGQRTLSTHNREVKQPISRSDHLSSVLSGNQATRHVWPKLVNLVLESTHISANMLALTAFAPHLISVVLRQADQKQSSYDWERECATSERDAVNNLHMMTDEHLIILSHCRSLSSIIIEGCNQLTARALVALSFVGSLQSVTFQRCHGITYQLACELVDSNACVDVGDDTHPRMSAIDKLMFIECSGMRSELPLGLPQKLRHAMTQWSMERMSRCSKISQINQSLNPSQCGVRSHQRTVRLGPTMLLAKVEADFLLSAEFSDQAYCCALRASSDLVESNLHPIPLALLGRLCLRHVSMRRQLMQYLNIGCLVVDRVNISITPSYQAVATSHHEWKPLDLWVMSDIWSAALQFVFAMVLGVICGVVYQLAFDKMLAAYLAWSHLPLIPLALYYEYRWPWSWRPGYDEELDTTSEDANRSAHRHPVTLITELLMRLPVNCCPYLNAFVFAVRLCRAALRPT